MEFINSEKSGLKISRIIYGGWAIGGWYWGAYDDPMAVRSIDAALDAGIQTFDTAPVYGMGHSECIIGKALKGKSDAVIATKCGLRYDQIGEEGVHFFDIDEYSPTVQVFRNLHHDSLLYECEQSLRRLKRDWIDIYQIHWPDRSADEEETAEALNRLYQEGKIRSAGVCNHTVEKLIRLEKYLSVPLAFDQEKLSLLHQKSLEGNIPYVKKNKITFFAYGTMAQGLLSDKMGPERKFALNDYRNKSDLHTVDYRKSVAEAFEKMKDLCERYSCTYANLATAWALYASGKNSCAITGIRNENQALENSRACSIQLNGNEAEALTETFSSIHYRGKW
ncbi:MAG: aldo/keto reductase [Spirochaetia bacterium]|nr:aldo/keto reductase [Spirochaetia bacterium]